MNDLPRPTDTSGLIWRILPIVGCLILAILLLGFLVRDFSVSSRNARQDYLALYGSVNNDWSQVEMIEQYRVAGLHATSIRVAADCLKYLTDFKLPDGLQPTMSTNIAGATTDLKYDAFRKLRRMVDIERAGAQRDLINHLRSKSGTDFGDDPQKWIHAYANAK